MNDDENKEEIEDVEEATEDELDKALKNEKAREKSELENMARSEVNKLAKKGTKKLKASLFKSVGASAFTVVSSIIIVVFMLIGIVSFIVSMPGFVQQRMYDLVNNLGLNLKEWWSGSNAFLNDPDSEEFHEAKLNLLKYLDKMGFNPVGMGFVAIASRNSETGEIINYIEDFITKDMLQELIDVKLHGSSVGDLLYKYIVSAERTYVINDDGFKGILGITNKNDFKGMLSFTVQNGLEFGPKIKVNRENKSLEIVEKSYRKTQTFRYDLDSWVGRYGKPIEFLLALHIATMSPDLTEAMIDDPNLQTNVQINVHKQDYAAEYSVSFKNSEGEMVESPIKYGNAENKLYDKLMNHLEINVHDDGTITFDYKDTDEVNASDITIAGLYDLITLMNPATNPGYVHKDENVYVSTIMNEGIQTFLSSDWYMTKTTVGSYDVMKACYSEVPYLCKLQSNNGYYITKIPNQDTGIFPYTKYGEYRAGIEWEKIKGIENGQEVEKDGPIGNMYYDGFNSVRALRFNKDARYAVTDQDPYYNVETNTLMGIQAYIDNPEQFFTEDNYSQNCRSVFAMLVAIDQLFYYNNEVLWGKIQWEEFNPASPDRNPVYDDWLRNAGLLSTGDDRIYMNLSKEWINFLVNKYPADVDRGEFSAKLRKFKNQITAYYDVINNREKYIQQFVDDILAKEIGEDARGKLKLDDIKKIHEKLYDSPKTVEFDEPRILYVVKHWFKDIDFRNAYEKTDSTKNIKLDMGDDSEWLDVTMNLSGKRYTQTSQPYVIKGNTVTLNGEDKTEEYENLIGGVGGIGSIGAGEGYKASKKLFTQGCYYVYDGTEATSKGIYYNKILERTKPDCGKVYRISVVDGRIHTLSPINQNEVMKNKDAWNVEGTKIKTEYDDCCNILYYQTTDVTNSNSERIIAKWYYVYVKKDISYKLPTQVSYEESMKSAERINAILDAMGIVNKREVVSFNNVVTTYTDTNDGEKKSVTYSGDTAMLTAFNVLENMHTEAANHIYRDLKEFLIDLGYYTSAEFDYINTNVLEWFIPDYFPQDPSHWKQNTNEDALEYGVVMYPKQESENNENDEEDKEENIPRDGFDPDSDIIAPGNCRIIKHSTNHIAIEFDGISQPEIGLLNGYTMIISGINVKEELELEEGTINIKDAKDNKTVIKCGTVIGSTKNQKLVVVLLDNKGVYISNVENYMAPKQEFANWDGNFTEKLLYWLARLEGMPKTSDPYYSYENGGVNWLNGEESVTVGPGLYMLYQADRFAARGVDVSHIATSDWKNYTYDKKIAIDIYIELLEECKAEIEGLGLNLKQNQVEALLALRWQQGGAGVTYKNVINALKNGGNVKNAWLDPTSSVFSRRMAEYELFSAGKYCVQGGGASIVEITFDSETPFTDFVDGK